MMFLFKKKIGEYAMLQSAAAAGVMNLKPALLEILHSMRRAGADVIITYFAPEILQWFSEEDAVSSSKCL